MLLSCYEGAGIDQVTGGRSSRVHERGGSWFKRGAGSCAVAGFVCLRTMDQATRGFEPCEFGLDRRVAAKKGPSCIWPKWVAGEYKGSDPVSDKRGLSMGLSL